MGSDRYRASGDGVVRPRRRGIHAREIDAPEQLVCVLSLGHWPSPQGSESLEPPERPVTQRWRPG
ncbi:MAG: hypothetical protein KTR25_21175 [Myxococcales bacterium]|nr:hypothetical protein [Myxococcales bacterium]